LPNALSLSLQDYIALLGIVFTVISAIAVAAITYYNPKKVEIREKMLDRVYHPLSKMLLIKGDTYSKEYLREIKRILRQNYHLCYPHTIDHFGRVEMLVDYENEFGPQDPAELKRAFGELLISIRADCDYLRRKVGYPTGNHLRLFSGGTVRQNLSLWYRMPILPFIYVAVVLYIFYRIDFTQFVMACGFLSAIVIKNFIRAYIRSRNNHKRSNPQKH
jgi:hypothetical protein